jgi:hypothetical protein
MTLAGERIDRLFTTRVKPKRAKKEETRKGKEMEAK